MVEELVVYQKTYDWLLWLKSAVERFSRAHKYSLGQQLQQESMLLLRNIIVANYRTDKSTIINDCLVQQEIIKVLVRLSKDYSLFTGSQYEFAARQMTEIGRLLVGWRRKFS